MGENHELVQSNSAMKAAGKYLREHVRPETHKAGTHANEATEGVTEARGDLKDWDIHAGLKKRHAEWSRHFKQLEERLNHEQSALGQTNNHIGETDLLTGSRINSINGTGGYSPSPGPALPHSKLWDLS